MELDATQGVVSDRTTQQPLKMTVLALYTSPARPEPASPTADSLDGPSYLLAPGLS